MNRMWVKVLLLAIALVTVGCSSKQQSGRLIGAVAGGLIGNQIGSGSGNTAATIIGTIVGAQLGGHIAEHMDELDVDRTEQALEDNRTHEGSRWTNPDTGYDYEVTPTRTYQSDAGPCREYTTEAWIDGQRETLYGTACRQPDGTWQAANG